MRTALLTLSFFVLATTTTAYGRNSHRRASWNSEAPRRRDVHDKRQGVLDVDWNSDGGKSKPIVAAGWFGGWHVPDYPVRKISWDMYTHLFWAFAETTPDPHKLDLSASSPESVPEFVALAHLNNVKAGISIGGWTGSRFFSSAMDSPKNRTIFVKTVIDLVQKYNFDGIDFDWEYPGSQGLGCNTISANDTKNFLAFLRELRFFLPRGIQVSAAVGLSPFSSDDQGTPSEDVSGFADVLNWIELMNYDIWGPWCETAGPNAPLTDACAPKKDQIGSAVSGVNAWNAAGIPLNQIVLGVPGYGHSYNVSVKDAYEKGPKGQKKTLALYPKFDADHQPLGNGDEPNSTPNACGVIEGPGGSFDYWALVKGGWISKEGVAQDGIDQIFDECSQTPFVYNASSTTYISYDDPRSFAAKGHWLKKKGVRGFAVWESDSDFKDVLLTSIRNAVGLDTP